jgi:hypothetical protein
MTVCDGCASEHRGFMCVLVTPHLDFLHGGSLLIRIFLALKVNLLSLPTLKKKKIMIIIIIITTTTTTRRKKENTVHIYTIFLYPG